MVLLFDQYTRNIYKQQREAFIHDYISRTIALGEIFNDRMHQYTTIEKTFFVVCLEHSEDLEVHKIAARLLEQMVEESASHKGLNDYVKMM